MKNAILLMAVSVMVLSLMAAQVPAETPGRSDERIQVFVSIVPQTYFVKQIGKDLVDVHVMVHPGASPATYEPKPRQMADLTKTKVYFAIGVPFENAWLNKIAAINPKMKVVHTDRDIPKMSMAGHHGHDARENRDPHIWLSPPLVKIQARTILRALQEIDPLHRAVYQTNFNQFSSKIDELDAQLRQMFAGRQGLQFLTFHPSWGYFAHTYGLEQIPIEIQGKEPKPAQSTALIEYARKRGINVVFVQPQFSTKSAEVVARQINGQVVFANPLAADWMTNLQEVAEKFKAALK